MENPIPTRGAPGGRRYIRGLVITLLVAAVVASALYASVEYFGSSNSALAGVCGTLSIERRGLPCDVPLPAGARFEEFKSFYAPETGVESDWTFMTPHAHTVIAYYRTAFGVYGWACVHETDIKGLYITGWNKSDRPGQSVEKDFLMATADDQVEFEISLFQRDPFAGTLSCS